MEKAAENKGGAMTGFMGLGMAQQAGGMNANELLAMGQQQKQQNAAQAAQSAPAAASADTWTCSCGRVNTGKFCDECGNKKPDDPGSWTCGCGTVNKGKFCSECGKQKSGKIICPKCGYAIETENPKFCPECGEKF